MNIAPDMGATPASNIGRYASDDGGLKVRVILTCFSAAVTTVVASIALAQEAPSSSADLLGLDKLENSKIESDGTLRRTSAPTNQKTWNDKAVESGRVSAVLDGQLVPNDLAPTGQFPNSPFATTVVAPISGK